MDAASDGIGVLTRRNDRVLREEGVGDSLLAIGREVVRVAQADGALRPSDLAERMRARARASRFAHSSSIGVDRSNGVATQWRPRPSIPEFRHPLRIDRHAHDLLDPSRRDRSDQQIAGVEDPVAELGLCLAEDGGVGVADHHVFDVGVEADLADIAEGREVFEDLVGAFDVALPGAGAFDAPDDVFGPESAQRLAVADVCGLQALMDEQGVRMLDHGVSDPNGRRPIIRPSDGEWEEKMAGSEEFVSDSLERRLDLAEVLATLTTHYTFDGNGRIVSGWSGRSDPVGGSASDGLPPRFVLGRAAEGCVWRFRADLPLEQIQALARLAAREPGARFDGELPAAPERLAALVRVLETGVSSSKGFSMATNRSNSTNPRHDRVTRSGVTLGEIWLFD